MNESIRGSRFFVNTGAAFSPVIILFLIFLFKGQVLRHELVSVALVAAFIALDYVIILQDLWGRRLRTRDKVMWSILGIAFGFITFPIYWHAVILKSSTQRE
jgi:hypothetical protein